MKELSIDEKAKRFDEALEVARSIRFGNPNSATANVVCEDIFPELKEINSEKIRKEIADFICWATDRGSITKEQREKSNSWLAWLEKQDTQTIKEALRTEYEKGRADAIAEFEKQGKQKPIEWNADDLLKRNQIMDILQEYNRTELITWLEKRGEHKPAADLKTWRNIVDEVLTRFVGIGQHLDSSRATAIAKDLQKKYSLEQSANITDDWIEDYWQHEKINNPDSYDKGDEIQFDHQGFVNFCRKYCQKHAEWSEEDKKMLEKCIDAIKYARCEQGEDDDLEHEPCILWLESIKYRVQIQSR